MRIWLCLLVFSICSAGFCYSLARIDGVVVDTTGAVVAGAAVRLQISHGSAALATVTDAAGRFHFPDLNSGNYVIEVKREGFRTTFVTVAAGQPVTIVLPVAAADQQVTVRDSLPQVNTEPAGNRDSTEVGANLLEQLPTLDQDYISTLSMFLDPGATGTAGVSLIVDGMEANRVGVSASAIQQIKINNDPYAAEYFRPGRGRIEIITKPAAPEYHGTFNLIFRDSRVSAKNAFAVSKPPEQRRAYEGVFTGPIAHRRDTFFQISVSRQELDTQAVVFAQGLTGPIQQNVVAPRRNTDVSARVTHVFTDRHSDTLDYSLEQSGTSNSGVGGVVLASAGTRSFSQEHQWGFSDTFTVSPRLLNQFQIRYEKNRDSLNSIDPGQKIVVVDAFTAGGAQVDQWRTENALHLNEIVTMTKKRQVIKAGVNIPNISFRSIVDHSNFAGSYYFSSLTSYAMGQPYSFTAQLGNGSVDYQQLEMGCFFQDEVRVRPNLALTFGMRYDWQNRLHDNNNFAPRFSFAYSPGKKGKLVVRGGAGVFYDRTGVTTLADLRRYDGAHLESIVLTNPAYPDAFGGGAPGALPTNIVELSPAINTPYTIQYGIGLERQLTKGSTLAINYRGSEGFHLFRSRDVNAPLPPLYSARPDPQFGTVRQIESVANQVGHAFEISVKGHITHNVTGMAQYTLSKTYNNTDGIASFPANSADPSGEWGRASFDQRHRLNLLETFEFRRFVSLGVGLRVYSGSPYTITTGLDRNHDGLANERPLGVSRNSAHGPGFASMDLRAFHDFKLSKARRDEIPTLTAAIDAFNLFNTENYPTFVGDLSSPFFGRPVLALDPRRMQLTIRMKF